MGALVLVVFLGPWGAPTALGAPTDTAATQDTATQDTTTQSTTPQDTGTTPPTDTAAPTGTTPTDTGLDLDRDGDGYTPNEGDCDDDNRNARPGLPEVCEDQADNDCDGLYDEGCDSAVRLASLRGGGGCTGGSGIAGTQGVVLLLPLALWRRRR